MTLAALPRLVEYQGQDDPATCPVTFQFFDKGELAVTLRDGSGAESAATGYTVTGGNGAAGAVAFSGSTAGSTIVIRGATTIVQQQSIPAGGTFPTLAVERSLDRGIAIDREQQDQIDDTRGRAPLAPAGETMGTLPALADRRNRLPVYGDSGDLAAMAPIATGQAVVTLSPAGTPVAMSIEAITGRSTDLTGFDGGFDGLDGSGQTYDGGLDG